MRTDDYARSPREAQSPSVYACLEVACFLGTFKVVFLLGATFSDCADLHNVMGVCIKSPRLMHYGV